MRKTVLALCVVLSAGGTAFALDEKRFDVNIGGVMWPVSTLSL